MRTKFLQAFILVFLGHSAFGQVALYGVTVSGGSHSDGQVFQLCEVSGTWYYTDLHDFPAATSTASSQASGTLAWASNNKLYGLSYYGGSSWNGEIFSYTNSTSTFADLYSLAAQTNDNLITQCVNGGELFSMTNDGGATYNGTIFKYNYNTGTYTTLHTFAGEPNDGAAPVEDNLLWYRDTLYGVTELGGNKTISCGFGGTCSYGTIFSLDTAAGRYRILYNFPAVGSANTGSEPVGAIVQTANAAGDACLYGVCYYGGANSSMGCIWQYDLKTYTYSDIYDFKGSASADGYAPMGGLCLASDGNLYGTTALGGNNASAGFGTGDGTLFKISPTTHTYTLLHTMSGGTTDGVYPAGGLVQASDGNIYGMCDQGGNAGGGGIAFKYNIGTSTYSVIYNFSTSNGTGYEPIYNTFATSSNTLCSTLPISLTSFTGTYNPSINASQLEWETATEVDNHYFFIERTQDGHSWTRLDTIAGAGNSDQIRNYLLNDPHPPIGTNYYMLTQQDYDGHEKSFNVVTIVVPEPQSISIYPNPVTDIVNVEGKNIATLQIYNTLGQLVWSGTAANDKVSVDMSAYSNGIYILQTIDKLGKTTVLKFIKENNSAAR